MLYPRRHYWKITPKGIDFLSKSPSTLETLLRECRAKNGTPPVAPDPPPPPAWIEGAKRQVMVNRYERETDPAIRAACLGAHGKLCWVCGFNFEEVYGELGRDFIYVHHRFPVSLRAAGGPYKLDAAARSRASLRQLPSDGPR